MSNLKTYFWECGAFRIWYRCSVEFHRPNIIYSPVSLEALFKCNQRLIIVLFKCLINICARTMLTFSQANHERNMINVKTRVFNQV